MKNKKFDLWKVLDSLFLCLLWLAGCLGVVIIAVSVMAFWIFLGVNFNDLFGDLTIVIFKIIGYMSILVLVGFFGRIILKEIKEIKKEKKGGKRRRRVY